MSWVLKSRYYVIKSPVDDNILLDFSCIESIKEIVALGLGDVSGKWLGEYLISATAS